MTHSSKPFISHCFCVVLFHFVLLFWHKLTEYWWILMIIFSVVLICYQAESEVLTIPMDVVVSSVSLHLTNLIIVHIQYIENIDLFHILSPVKNN